MHAEPLKPVGALITGVPVGALGLRQTSWLRTQLAEHGVVILRDQNADDEGLLDFLRSFGRVVFTQGETPVDGHPDLNIISNVGRTRPPRSSFHVDTSYVQEPPAYTALRAVRIPAHGGQTLFSNQYRAHDTLPEHIRRDLARRSITHVATGVSLSEGDEAQATHPALRTHPVSGRTALFLSTPPRCRSVSGLTDRQAGELVGYLFEHSTRDDNVLRHSWLPGDVVVWDNRVVMHRADHQGVIGDRVMHRGMVTDGAAPRQLQKWV